MNGGQTKIEKNLLRALRMMEGNVGGLKEDSVRIEQSSSRLFAETFRPVIGNLPTFSTHLGPPPTMPMLGEVRYTVTEVIR